MSTENVPLRPGFEQVCVIYGLKLGSMTSVEFEERVGKALFARIQFLEVIETLPDRDAAGRVVPETGGRSDVFLAVENDYSPEFNVERMLRNVRWLEDVVSKSNFPNGILYPERVLDYLSPKVRSLLGR
ncbi:MAG: hypothetical protein Q8Q09_28390 [Deltaproteobacteria bacterium]|nr:hypothetical protein [Deltaproteobacteria bacterium]